jgi:hypothetical protein
MLVLQICIADLTVGGQSRKSKKNPEKSSRDFASSSPLNFSMEFRALTLCFPREIARYLEAIYKEQQDECTHRTKPRKEGAV